MFINILLLLLGFFILIKGADLFVEGASSIATNVGISKMCIGLTIVAFGTSLPELAVSLTALAKGSGDMVLGNVIGSNIFNSLFILGVGALITPILVKKNTVKKEMPFCILLSSVLVVLFLDNFLNKTRSNTFSRIDALITLLFFFLFIYYIYKISKNNKPEKGNNSTSLIFAIFLSLIGLGSLILGSHFVVSSAIKLANMWSITERIISLTIVAFGTSLPELVTTIIASLKKEQEILLGNIIGSNIFNICIVLAIPVALFGSITPPTSSSIDLIMLLTSSVLLFIFALTKKEISRLEGGSLLFLFFLYYIMVFLV